MKHPMRNVSSKKALAALALILGLILAVAYPSKHVAKTKSGSTYISEKKSPVSLTKKSTRVQKKPVKKHLPHAPVKPEEEEEGC